ncbi:hypothetical protein TUM12370_24490 [Salmonella enterica subsp. enterica serovar Choleraesuis]|nr:hypothetical protein TUM12370_24490 [Salmonella enterica subsp. enterica serovar Choleraesuis]
MMQALILKYWRPLALIGLVAVLLVGYGHWRYSVATDEWQKRWAARDLADAKSLEQQQTAARTEEQRRQQAINRVTDDAQKQIEHARADAAAANHAADSLRDAIDRTTKRLAASEATSDTCTTAAGKAAADAARVLADVLKRADERAGRLAEIADQRGVAGLACERAYGSIRGDEQ